MSGHDPYLIEGPALISFSGGRTSAYMLYQILQAHGGAIPDDVVVAFANTGKEREETLRFVHECGSRWGVSIRWVEWRPMPERFVDVGLNSAARNGEPFDGLIALRGRLPNPRQRFCSRELKVEPIKAMCLSLGWKHWSNVIGLRHDEGLRCLRKYAENDTGGHRWTNAMPMDKARATKRDVLAFWAKQPFDLELMGHEGNCDLCFLKSDKIIRAIIADRPHVEDWWVRAEAKTGKRFERDRSYASLAASAHAQQSFVFDGDDYDAECHDIRCHVGSGHETDHPHRSGGGEA
jgi:3'-phosphoadenosine 5'-phosphosulfate sulfotransferase (PAPS reductase)/FAD synthetase